MSDNQKKACGWSLYDRMVLHCQQENSIYGDSCFFIALFVENGRFVIQAVRKAQKGDARCKKAGRTTDRNIEEQEAGK